MDYSTLSVSVRDNSIGLHPHRVSHKKKNPIRYPRAIPTKKVCSMPPRHNRFAGLLHFDGSVLLFTREFHSNSRLCVHHTRWGAVTIR